MKQLELKGVQNFMRERIKDQLIGLLRQTIFPRHALRNRAYIYSISGVIILNNDQHQHQKQYQQTTGLIKKLIDNIPLFD